MGDVFVGPNLISYFGPQAYMFLRYCSILSSSEPGFPAVVDGDCAEGEGLAGRGAPAVCAFPSVLGLRPKQSKANSTEARNLRLYGLSSCRPTNSQYTGPKSH